MICPKASPSESWTSGAIVATGRDLARFCDGLLGGALLGGAWLNRMTTGTQVLDEHRQRGLGIVRFRFPLTGTPAYGHQGGMPGYTSVVARTEAGRSVVVLQNGIDMHGPLSSDNEFMQVALATHNWIRGCHRRLQDRPNPRRQGETMTTATAVPPATSPNRRA